LQAKAKRYGATIYWGDEASIRSDYHAGTTWAEKGKTPVIKTTGARFKVNMISAVSAKGVLRFMVTEKGLTAPDIAVLSYLAKIKPNKVGVNRLANICNMSTKGFLANLEPFLQREGEMIR